MHRLLISIFAAFAVFATNTSAGGLDRYLIHIVGEALDQWEHPEYDHPKITFPDYVQCLPEKEGKKVLPARSLTLQLDDGTIVRYLIDHPFAIDTGTPNVSDLYSKQFSDIAIQVVELRCEDDRGQGCTYLTHEVIAPLPKTWDLFNDLPDRQGIPASDFIGPASIGQ